PPGALMSRPGICLLLTACLALGPGIHVSRGPAPARDPKTPKATAIRTDRCGDTLSPGAIARLGTMRFRSEHSTFAFSPDRKTLALLDERAIHLCDFATGKLVRKLPVESPSSHYLSLIGFSPDGKAFCCTGEEAIQMWEVATGKQLWHFHGPESSYPGGVFASDNKTFISWARDNTVRW